jgi:hypothetical protein
MAITAMITALMPAASAALQLAAAGVKKVHDAGEINTYIDRSKLFDGLFNDDEQAAHEAWGKLMAEIFRVLATKGITPSIPWRDETKDMGSPCVKIPVATIKELLDAATR